MKVLEYTARNVQKVSDITFNLEGHNLFIVGGKNEQGKSSAIKALLMVLCGRQGMDYPEVALKEGEAEGWVKVKLSGDSEMHDLDSFTVELFLKRKRDKSVVEEFRILDSSGEEAPEPRTLLKKLFKMRAFDPLAFEKLDRKGKRAMMQALVGLDFTAQNETAKKAYAERTAVNREAAKLKAQHAALTFHKGIPDEEIASSDMLAKLEERQATNKANAKARSGLVAIEKDLVANSDELAAVVTQITNLENKRTQLRAERKEHETVRDAMKAHVSKLVDEDETEIRTQMKDLDATNAKVRENAKYMQAGVDHLAKQEEADALTKQLTDIAEEQRKALAAAKFPVEGMSLDEEGVLFNGLPFEQANKATRVLASVDVGMALNPTLRLLVCECGGDLDTETLAALETKLVANDFQMIVELVTRSESDEKLCAVIIKDGKVL